MPRGDKYLGLKYFLQKVNQPMVRLTFEQVESIIGKPLPASAIKYAEAWWSNNKDSLQAISWLGAGYETDYVTDTYKDKSIVFVQRK